MGRHIVVRHLREVTEFVHELDYYELLGVNRTASSAELRSAYRALVKTLHPDAGGTSGAFQLVNHAYETLSNPQTRADYDRDSHVEAITVPAPSTRSRTRTGTRPRPQRKRPFGEDPYFVPPLPRLNPQDIPWWNAVYSHPARSSTPQKMPGDAPAAMVVGTTPLLALPTFTPISWSPAWMTLAAVIASLSAWLVRFHIKGARVSNELQEEFGDETTFGQPGNDRDQRAERLTAEVLDDYLTHLPGVRIFHSLALPGSVFADVDHAILFGDRLVLIESKMWSPGHYGMDDSGTLWRNENRFLGGTSRLPHAISAYRRLLPQLDIRGAIIIYPNRKGAITTDGRLDSLAPPMTATQFVALMGDWLAVGPSTVDTSAFRTLLDQVVHHSDES